MIDIHSHVLPFLDDGPDSYEHFKELARQAVSSGVTHLVATPHHNRRYENPKDKIIKHISHCNQYLKMKNINLTIYPGQEYRIHREILNPQKENEILTINQGNYLLLELPPHEVPDYTNEVIYELLLKSITPIIVHPERNKELQNNPSMIYEFVQEGALIQLTAGSVIGKFGGNVKKLASRLIDHQLVHVLASDAHNIHTRGFCLDEAYKEISKSFGHQCTTYFQKNAKNILENKEFQIESPRHIKKRFFKFF
ncbi:CpsB/CapC family capsule biosynthesis tyrosine phosphatase [Bacillus sp. 31A1R]|uniref:Tyrosine-protein phosphatase n=1 Tax=Robertmurraya mangrovi TaxID=3098077 RepID=A0ABU5ITE9_9BACI|nr:CpsB/CapC family capsule biosynthesis tyrosine phosphatase [Bacillus sp. 31A1R]MDZ5470437.1 CpsB/CapC family capsule biosynthesis tyrosine phosphatase [Bacillus sp. 31A1R]